MNTSSPLTRRYDIHYDKMIDHKIIAFIDMHPSRMGFIKDLIMAEYKRYLRAPKQYRRRHGLQEEAPR